MPSLEVVPLQYNNCNKGILMKGKSIFSSFFKNIIIVLVVWIDAMLSLMIYIYLE